MNDSAQFTSIYTLANRFEADLLMDALRQEGIPALLRGFEETPYTGLFVPQKGWGRIMVPCEMEDMAREIVEAFVEDVRSTDAPYTKSSEIDPVLWERLREADPAEIAGNSGVEYDDQEEVYIIPFFNTAIVCWPESEKMEIIGEFSKFSRDFQLHLFVLHYLLESQERPLSKKWVTEKDLPSGALFFSGPHALPLEPFAKLFDTDPELLHACAQKMGGEKVNLGDISYEFSILPRVPLLIIFWLGDEEFRPTFHLLFDDTISLHLPVLDQVFALANTFTRILMYSAKSLKEGGQDEQ